MCIMLCHVGFLEVLHFFVVNILKGDDNVQRHLEQCCGDEDEQHVGSAVKKVGDLCAVTAEPAKEQHNLEVLD